MLSRLFACAFLICVFVALGVDAGGVKKVDPPKKVDDTKKEAKREFDEKAALTGVVKSVDAKKNTFVLTLEKPKKDRTFKVTEATEYFGPRDGDRNSTGINDECFAPGYELKVIPNTDGKVALYVKFDVRKTDEKKDEPKKK